MDHTKTMRLIVSMLIVIMAQDCSERAIQNGRALWLCLLLFVLFLVISALAVRLTYVLLTPPVKSDSERDGKDEE